MAEATCYVVDLCNKVEVLLSQLKASEEKRDQLKVRVAEVESGRESIVLAMHEEHDLRKVLEVEITIKKELVRNLKDALKASEERRLLSEEGHKAAEKQAEEAVEA
ncbi:PREDICTED: uncharacterized protein LOC104604773 [Nelumbo nucifera]|uniref:Uncharacterized protein LOC104604773 n=1 Tax=Nelumbo nucifera TaxID=4432 RepID=A0A1U8AIQ3_NELNU|nr:PREDICTED: uncharacterized protein LOC104604773 [Nelumbo nucifera]